MDKIKALGKYLFFGGVLGIGVAYDANAVGGFTQWAETLGLQDGLMGAAIAYLVWENKKKLEGMDKKIDKIEDKITRWGK